MDPVDVRFRVDSVVYDKVLKWLSEAGHAVLASCFESPRDENPHYHLYVRATVSIDALRRQRTRRFQGDDTMKGNGPMAISPMDEPQKYKEYMCKGVQAYKDKNVWAGKSMPKVEIYDKSVFSRTAEEYNNYFWETRVEFKATRAMKTKTYAEQICARFEDEHKPGEIIEMVKAHDSLEGDEDPTYLQREAIIEWVMDQYVRDIKVFDIPMIAKVVNLIMFKYRQSIDPSSFKHSYEKFKQSVYSYCLRGGL